MKGIKKALTALKESDYFMIVMDEILISLRDSIINKEDLEPLLKLSCPSPVYLIMTGRGAPEWLIERAELVSSIEEIKHPFTKGKKCCPGIEY